MKEDERFPEFEPGDLKPHEPLLAKVPREYQEKRLRTYRLKAEAFDRPSLVCQLKKVNEREFHEWVHPLDPVSLDDLKNWFGIPNEVAKMSLERPSARSFGTEVFRQEMPLHLLPRQRDIDFDRLEPPQREAVRHTANALLYGYVEPRETEDVPLAGVVRFMLERAKGVKAFVAPNLIVCPGEKVQFASFATLIFNNILVYGDGELVPGNQTKINAYQVRRA